MSYDDEPIQKKPSSGVSLYPIFFIVGMLLVVAKLAGAHALVDTSWWVVLLPFYIHIAFAFAMFALFLILLVVIGVVGLVFMIIVGGWMVVEEEWRRYRRRK